MNKILVALALVLAAGNASAMDLGTGISRDYAGSNRGGLNLTLGQKYGVFGVTGGYESFTLGPNNQNRYSLVGSYDYAKLGSAKFDVKAGVAYLNNQTSSDGYAMLVGTGVTIPVTKGVAATFDLRRQYGQDRVSSFNGNTIGGGLKFSF
jgi:hypothetical protein